MTVKVEETFSMVKNMVIPFIEAKECKDGNIHNFKIVNIEWVSKVTVLRRLKILKASRIAIKCFLEHEIPF